MMKNNQRHLWDLVKTARLGQVEIRSILDTTLGAGLRSTLEGQLREYDSIETEAWAMALQRGWDLPQPDPGRCFWKDRVTRMQITGRDTDSRVADLLIRGNTRGMIRGLKGLHRLEGEDRQLRILSQKLLDCENAHIRQMQRFL